MLILTLIFSFLTSAEVKQTELDITTLMGLTKEQLEKGTQDALEKELYYDEDGISCGLEEFAIDHYTIPSLTSPTEFSVITDTVGPKNYCGGYDTYKCTTTWKLENTQWSAKNVVCGENDL